MNYSSDPHDLQHPVVMSWFSKLVLPFRSPRVGARPPTGKHCLTINTYKRCYNERHLHKNCDNRNLSSMPVLDDLLIRNLKLRKRVYLSIFSIIIPSTGGNSTSRPSTSSLMWRCKSFTSLFFTIFCNPILK